MQGDQPVLDVHSRAHFEGAAHEDPNAPGADLCKQLLLLGIGIGIVDESNLPLRDAHSNEFTTDVLIDGKGRVRLDVLQQIAQGVQLRPSRYLVSRRHSGPVPCGGGSGFRGGQVAENELGQLVRLPVLPNAEHVFHAHIDLTGRIVGEKRVNQPLIEAEFPCVIGDCKHIVNFGVHLSCVNGGGAVRQLLDQLLLFLRGQGLFRMIFYLRHGEMELIGGLDVGGLPEHGHQLRQIVESGKACPGTVFALRGQFHLCYCLSKNGCPTIKVCQAVMPSPAVGKALVQKVLLQISLHGK